MADSDEPTNVVSLGAHRTVKQLKGNRAQLMVILENNRDALGRLFETGLVYHVAGSKAARDLLLAHELLLTVLDTLESLDEAEGSKVDLQKLQRMISRIGMLTSRSGEKLKTLLPK